MSEVVVDPSYKPLGFATDDGNMNFAGARDPDSALFVQFYTKAVQDNWQTMKQGRPIFVDRLHIRIEIPGNRNSIIDTFATAAHKQRFYRQWQFYQSKHTGDDGVQGTPLSAWSILAASRVEELKAMGFRTVEQVAAASDQNIKNIGMTAGIDAFAFRDRAKRFLKAAQDDSVVQNTAEENAKLREQIEAEKKAREDSDAKHAAEMAELREMIANANAVRRKPGRPPKEVSG